MASFLTNSFVSIMELENSANTIVSTCLPTTWGNLFYNAEWKERHDANKAIVRSINGNEDEIISSIINFYSPKKLTPRLDFYAQEQREFFIGKLLSAGFVRTEILPMSFMVCIDPHRADCCQSLNDINIEIGNNSTNDDIIGKYVTPILREDGDYNRIVTNENFYYFVIHKEKKPISMLNIYVHQQLRAGLIGDVYTVTKMRNKGYGTAIMVAALEWLQNHDLIPTLWVVAENARRIYNRLGFKSVMEFHDVSWYLK